MSGKAAQNRSDTARPNTRKDTAAQTAAISPARAAAFEVLSRVGEGADHSDDLLHTLRVTALSPQDRNLTTALVMGVLRWQIAFDAQIAKLLARPDQRLAEPVALALRLGAFQLLHMDRIPAHAAINESVELCRTTGHAHASGMVNAILRGIARRQSAAKPTNEATAKRRTPIFESPAAFAERLGHPAWLAERWVANYGREAALAICEYDQREPGDGALFAASADGTAAAMPQIDDGSRLVAELAAIAAPASKNAPARVWDCCAAPGGKTLVLAERLPHAAILATDISAKRLARMKKRIDASSHSARIRCAVLDAANPSAGPGLNADAEHEALFDLILCDAPCSGTGTLACNPEIRHRLPPEDMARQAARQIAILRGALDKLAPGGRLLYSTCSLEPEENEQVVEAVLREFSGSITPLSIDPLLTGLAETRLAEEVVLKPERTEMLIRTAVRGGCLRTLPGIHPCDGFFAALLERAN